MRGFWKKYHKWVGLFFTLFVVIFCVSGIILNHRNLFSEYEVSRKILPKGYQFENWNNGIVKGSIKTADNEIMLFGTAGIWQTDSLMNNFVQRNEGFDKGVDNRKINNIVKTPDGDIWCATQKDIYKYSAGNNRWEKQVVDDCTERITDITTKGDTLVVVSRSFVYDAVSPYKSFTKHELKQPDGYEKKTSLFKTVWLIHSGEIFGLPGKLIVDFLGIVLIVLCVTGVLHFFLPSLIKRKKRKGKQTKPYTNLMKSNLKWHNKLGVWLIVLTVILSVTGMSLRPPLMIPLVLTKVSPIPYSELDSDNAWHDKLRAIRWDNDRESWIMSTSEGFFEMKTFAQTPVKMKNAPSISPMGINVFSKQDDGKYLIGSFSGMFVWDIDQETRTDYFTGEPVLPSRGRPIGREVVAGYSEDFPHIGNIVFDYSAGAMLKDKSSIANQMPSDMISQPMSLWNFALELHVGRCYNPFLGVFSELFVFLAGLILTLILISGYIIRVKGKRKKAKQAKKVSEEEKEN